MNKEFKNEELFENLPDFIEGRLNNEKLEEAILYEISINPEFRKEYDLLSGTIGSFRKYEFSEPPLNYFNNFLPGLNEKLDREKKKFGLSKSISFLWKLATPVAAILLLFFSYKAFLNNNENNYNIKNDTQVVFHNDFQENRKSEVIASDQNIEEADDESDDIYDYENIVKFFSKSENKKQTKEDFSNDLNYIAPGYLSENVPDEDIFFSNDDESNYEQIFDNMDKDQQNDILNKIKKF